MTLERQLTEALSCYAEGVTMSSSDIDRMQREVHRRLDQPHRPGGRVVIAVAAALLLVAVVVGGALWLRRPVAQVPAAPSPVGSLRGLWKFVNPDTNTLFVVRSDNSVRIYPNAPALVRHLAGDPGTVAIDGQRIVEDFKNAQRQPCRSSHAIIYQSDGFVAEGPETVDGPGCSSASPDDATITRLSPASAATRDLPTTTEGPAMPVTDAVQLDGVWLLQGTGLVLAADEKTGPAAYVMDKDGNIDSTPTAQGAVSVPADGQIVLGGGGCGDITLGHAEIRGQADAQTLTTTVVTDACKTFDGHPTLVWIKVLGA
jgi:hypothetical protein